MGDRRRVGLDILNRMGDRWSVHVLSLLGQGSRRFMDLRRDIDGISQRMRTVTLRNLERDGLISRTVHAVVPPRVDYALTPREGTLRQSIDRLVGLVVDASYRDAVKGYRPMARTGSVSDVALRGPRP